MAETAPISVVIPAYNREATVGIAIRSVLWQTYAPAEVIVVNDGSTDATAAVVSAVDDDRVRLVSQPNGGISAARNTGIREAVYPWIAFQDSDDEWLPLKLEKQMAKLTQSPGLTVAVYCGMLITGTLDDPADSAAGRSRIAYHPDPSVKAVAGEIQPTLLRSNPISTQTLIARRTALHEVGLFDTRLKSLVDWDIALRLAALGPIAFVDEPLVIQRFTPNSITHDTRKRVDSWILMLEKYRPLYEADRLAHVAHLVRIAGSLRRLNDHERASQYIWLAAKIDPLSRLVHKAFLSNLLRL